MTYNRAQLAALDAAAISRCSPKHMESVIAELIETARALASDAVRYDHLLTCDYIAARKYMPNLDEAEWKAKLRSKHDAATHQPAAHAPNSTEGSCDAES